MKRKMREMPEDSGSQCKGRGAVVARKVWGFREAGEMFFTPSAKSDFERLSSGCPYCAALALRLRPRLYICLWMETDRGRPAGNFDRRQ